jgi:hypothetical protein
MELRCDVLSIEIIWFIILLCVLSYAHLYLSVVMIHLDATSSWNT